MRNVLVITAVFLITLLYITNSTVSIPDKSKISPMLVEKADSGSSEKIKVIVQIDKEKYKKRNVFTTLSTPGKTVREFEIIPAVVMEVPANQLEVLAKQNYVKSIEPVLEVRAFLQDSVPLINATKVWTQQISQRNITGGNVAVCILDTGVNYTHPDLGGCFGSGCRVAGGYDYCGNTGPCGTDPPDSDPMDDNGHGTHVAGIVAANGSIIRGVAPNVSIIAIKVLNSTGYGTTEDLIFGIDWCVNNRTVYNISVISMSLGVGLYTNYCDNELPTLTTAINSAVGKNISVVAATGNNGNTNSISLPACIQNTTAVAWSTKTDTVATNSNRNSITDLIAPGSSINSTRLSPSSCLGGCSCSGNYMICSGTSMATPHVAGAIALLYQKYRATNGTDPTPSYLQQILNDTGKVISDSGGSNLNFMRIDVYAASIRIKENESPRWSNQNSNATLVNLTDTLLLSAYWTDNTALSNATLSTNETGSWRNISTTALSGLSAWSNFTWSNSSLTNGTVVTWRIYANDTSGNSNVTDTLNLTMIDSESPKYFNETNSTDNTYSPNKIYQFNITWTDNGNVNKVIFEWNGTNATINSSGSLYPTNKTNLAVGIYNYKWYANDTSGNWNSTSLLTYNVTQNTSTSQYLNIEFNGTLNSNKSYTYPQTINATAWKNITEGSLTLYRNSTQVSTGQTPNETVLLGNGTYNYTVSYLGTQNYSSGSKTYYVFINEGIPVIRVSSLTNVTYPTQTQTGCERVVGDSSSTLTLYRNGTQVALGTTSPINETSITLGAGAYNYTCTISVTENYTSSSSVNNYRTVSQNTSTSSFLTLTLNGTSSNKTGTYPESVNATGNYTASVFSGQNITITLYRDNNTINTTNPVSENILLGNGTYNYTYNTSSNANYSSGSVSFLFYQNKAATNITLFLNNTEGNMTFYKNQIVNITATINTTGLPIDISSNFTNNTQSVINSSTTSVFNLTNTSNLAIGTYNITAYYNGSNSNYSASSRTYFLTVRHQYQNDAISIVASIETVVNATNTTNVTLTIKTNQTVIGAINISTGTDNPTGTSIPHTGVNKFITIEANFTSNLTYVILNVSYNDVNISSSIDNSSLRLYYWNLTDWLRQNTNGGVNTTEEYVWANMTHFSNFTIGGLLANGQFCTSASQCSGGYCNSNLCASSAPTSTPSTSTGGGGGSLPPMNVSQNKIENKTVEIKNETKPENKTFQVCIQVITPAISPTGECKEFPTPCDVPANWTKVEKCPVIGPEVEKPSEITKLIVIAVTLLIVVLIFHTKKQKIKGLFKKRKHIVFKKKLNE